MNVEGLKGVELIRIRNVIDLIREIVFNIRSENACNMDLISIDYLNGIVANQKWLPRLGFCFAGLAIIINLALLSSIQLSDYFDLIALIHWICY